MTAASTIFTKTNHLFLRAPDGGVEDVANMARNGFGAIFCNIGDYPLERWQAIRGYAANAGVVCGPWLRTAEGGTGAFDPERLGFLLDVADEWGSPLIVNTEAEADHSGSEITEFIADECGARDWALSMQPWPFASVDWRPVGHVPILPQIFGEQWGADAEAARQEWFRVGAGCVVDTYGTYAIDGKPSTPAMYPMLSPYGLYTADDCGNDFAKWDSEGTHDPYGPENPPEPPPNGGETVEKIGPDHGITAMVDWLQMQPGMPARGPGYNPDIPKTWPWPERIERTLTILARDHDASNDGGV